MTKAQNIELLNYLRGQGYRELTVVPGKGLCGLCRYVFTVGLVVGLDKDGYAGRYCYDLCDGLSAAVSLKMWGGEGDPEGPWIKYKGIGGERRNPKLKRA